MLGNLEGFLSSAAEWVMAYLDPVGVVIGLIIAVPVVWTWFDVVIGQRRRRRRWFRDACLNPGERPAILVVDLLTSKDVRTSVENFRQQDEQLRMVPRDRIVRVSRVKRLTPDQMPELLWDIRRAVGELIAGGVDTVHCFHAGPALVSALVGAELTNACLVLLYQHEANGYRNFGPLRIEK